MFNTDKDLLEKIIYPNGCKGFGKFSCITLKQYNQLINSNFLTDECKYRNRKIPYKKFFEVFEKHRDSIISLHIHTEIFDSSIENPIVGITKFNGYIDLNSGFENRYNFFMDFFSKVCKFAKLYEMDNNGYFSVDLDY